MYLLHGKLLFLRIEQEELKNEFQPGCSSWPHEKTSCWLLFIVVVVLPSVIFEVAEKSPQNVKIGSYLIYPKNTFSKKVYNIFFVW